VAATTAAATAEETAYRLAFQRWETRQLAIQL
jgi:hypothetical protein